MKAPLINTKNLNITLNFFAPDDIPGLVAGESVELKPATCAHPTDVPAIGEYWEGQGGIYAGRVPPKDGQSSYYLIVAGDDVGRCAWSSHSHEISARRKWDGMANTAAMLESESPAARAAVAFVADGHEDFYLPARAELAICELNVPEVFANDRYWSSTQVAAGISFCVGLHDGSSFYGKKHETFLVRPVRRVLI
ncbi:DUF1566 domain-containing protein [Pseudomonas aeruginosa]|uniref:DUF1566 domain-containing protein n=1 Tax=Pseudomonas aeruginosa TaxID=287 RepID=A0A6B1YGS0_PSEAI|nr:DUF1566 domain-containing protein [Pseudomonas aeruginosa]KSO82464.1 DUF1566 domain-containing protein [Pseudomonas aeruginosa]MBH4337099.1 DUF1566 domain-containing protein [Pseudomonas aeruginosa]MBH4354007.1 DUF1566 domain-containing protein [Pseudomonas aeruginosa]MCT0662467.1 DUF1566 domain-containing protein [Pseudomonas aeruginosa]MCU9228992.1 DUF1566 domain-containing protein [Pseudomonas aeruginosa]